MSEFDTSSAIEDEFLHRQVCPDGSCIGLLDAQGVCKECGMVGSVATTDPRLRGFKKEDVATPPPETVEPETADVEDADPEDGSEKSVETAREDLPADFEDRQLCPDGSCIGLVGQDGVCGECGAVA
jgi:hypothetical protein